MKTNRTIYLGLVYIFVSIAPPQQPHDTFTQTLMQRLFHFNLIYENISPHILLRSIFCFTHTLLFVVVFLQKLNVKEVRRWDWKKGWKWNSHCYISFPFLFYFITLTQKRVPDYRIGNVISLQDRVNSLRRAPWRVAN